MKSISFHRLFVSKVKIFQKHRVFFLVGELKMAWTFSNFPLVSMFSLRDIWMAKMTFFFFFTKFQFLQEFQSNICRVHAEKRFIFRRYIWEFWRCTFQEELIFLPNIPTLILVAGNIIFCDFPQNSLILHVKVELNIQRGNGLLVFSVPYILNVGGTENFLDTCRQCIDVGDCEISFSQIKVF